MKKLFSILLLLLASGVAYGQQLVNCAPSTPCTSSGPINSHTGDAPYIAFSKINTNAITFASMFGPIGLLRGNGAYPNKLTAATATDVTNLFSGCSGSTIFLTSTGACGASALPSGTTNQLLYYAANGTTVTPLTLGTNLSITSGTLNASGGGNVSTSGTITQYGVPYWATTTAIASLLPGATGTYAETWSSLVGAPVLTAFPTSANCLSTNSAGAPAAGCPEALGNGGAPITAATYTVATTDCGTELVFENATSVAVTLPAATTSGFPGCQLDMEVPSGYGTATVTPGSGTISGNSSVAITANRQCTVNDQNSVWNAPTCTALVSGGSGITLENGGTSLGNITTLNCSTGTTCSASSGTGTITASGGSSANAALFTTNGSAGGLSTTTGISVPLANTEYVYYWNIPVPLSISTISIYVITADSTSGDVYSFGLYNSSGTLLCSTTAQAFTATGFVTLSCSQGSSIAVAPGIYALGYTGNATALKVSSQGSTSLTVLFVQTNAGATTSGAQMASITFPTLAIKTANGSASPFAVIQ